MATLARRYDIDITLHDPAWEEALPGIAAWIRERMEVILELSGAVFPAAHVELSVLLTDDEDIRRLNAEYRGKDKATNILSFSAQNYREGVPDNTSALQPVWMLGDIALAYATVAKEARDQCKPLALHVSHLLTHGALHLVGYNHENDAEAERMESLERAILSHFGIGDPYA